MGEYRRDRRDRMDESQGRKSHVGDKRRETREKESHVYSNEVLVGKKSHVEIKMDNSRGKYSQCEDSSNDREYSEDNENINNVKLHKKGERKCKINPELVMEAPRPGSCLPTENTDVSFWDSDAAPLSDEPRPSGWCPPSTKRVPVSLLDFMENIVDQILNNICNRTVNALNDSDNHGKVVGCDTVHDVGVNLSKPIKLDVSGRVNSEHVYPDNLSDDDSQHVSNDSYDVAASKAAAPAPIDASKVTFSCLDIRLKTGFPPPVNKKVMKCTFKKNCVSIILSGDREAVLKSLAVLESVTDKAKFVQDSSFVGQKVRRDLVFTTETGAANFCNIGYKYLLRNVSQQMITLSESDLGYSMAPVLTEEELMYILKFREGGNIMDVFDGKVKMDRGRKISFTFSNMASLNLFLYTVATPDIASMGSFTRNMARIKNEQELKEVDRKIKAKEVPELLRLIVQHPLKLNKKSKDVMKKTPWRWDNMEKIYNFTISVAISRTEKVLKFRNTLDLYQFWILETRNLMTKVNFITLENPNEMKVKKKLAEAEAVKDEKERRKKENKVFDQKQSSNKQLDLCKQGTKIISKDRHFQIKFKDEKNPLVPFDRECSTRTDLRGIMASKDRWEEEDLEEEREYRNSHVEFRGRGGFGDRGGCVGKCDGRVGRFQRGREHLGGNPYQLPAGQRTRFRDGQQQKDSRLATPRERILPAPRVWMPHIHREKRPPSPSERIIRSHPRPDDRNECSREERDLHQNSSVEFRGRGGVRGRGGCVGGHDGRGGRVGIGGFQQRHEDGEGNPDQLPVSHRRRFVDGQHLNDWRITSPMERSLSSMVRRCPSPRERKPTSPSVRSPRKYPKCDGINEDTREESEYRNSCVELRGRGMFGGRAGCVGGRDGRVGRGCRGGGFQRGLENDEGNLDQLPVGLRRRFGDSQQLNGSRRASPRNRGTTSPSVGSPRDYPRYDVRYVRNSCVEFRSRGRGGYFGGRDRRGGNGGKGCGFQGEHENEGENYVKLPGGHRVFFKNEYSSQNYKSRNGHTHGRRYEADPNHKYHASPPRSFPAPGYGKAPAHSSEWSKNPSNKLQAGVGSAC